MCKCVTGLIMHTSRHSPVSSFDKAKDLFASLKNDVFKGACVRELSDCMTERVSE